MFEIGEIVIVDYEYGHRRNGEEVLIEDKEDRTLDYPKEHKYRNSYKVKGEDFWMFEGMLKKRPQENYGVGEPVMVLLDNVICKIESKQKIDLQRGHIYKTTGSSKREYGYYVDETQIRKLTFEELMNTMERDE